MREDLSLIDHVKEHGGGAKSWKHLCGGDEAPLKARSVREVRSRWGLLAKKFAPQKDLAEERELRSLSAAFLKMNKWMAQRKAKVKTLFQVSP